MKSKSGIYRIRNKVNGKVYIGSSVDVNIRLYDHLNDLKGNRHANIILQRSFDKHGETTFEFAPIEYVELTKEKLLEREQCWMDFYQVTKYGYNICPNAASNLGRKCSDVTKKKMSESRKGKKNPNFGKKCPEWQKELISKASRGKTGEKSHNFGRKHSDESKKKISDAGRDRLVSKETREKISKANTGRKYSKESKRKMSASQKGRIISEEHKRKLSMSARIRHERKCLAS